MQEWSEFWEEKEMERIGQVEGKVVWPGLERIWLEDWLGFVQTYQIEMGEEFLSKVFGIGL